MKNPPIKVARNADADGARKNGTRLCRRVVLTYASGGADGPKSDVIVFLGAFVQASLVFE